MEYQTIIDERHGAVARIITNRPQYKNAQSRPMIEELDHAFAVANTDDEVRVISFVRAGDTFSSGHEIKTPEEKGFCCKVSFLEALRYCLPQSCDAEVGQWSSRAITLRRKSSCGVLDAMYTDHGEELRFSRREESHVVKCRHDNATRV
jgi:enoyl-CoA hydratase/carnithine racemase